MTSSPALPGGILLVDGLEQLVAPAHAPGLARGEHQCGDTRPAGAGIAGGRDAGLGALVGLLEEATDTHRGDVATGHGDPREQPLEHLIREVGGFPCQGELRLGLHAALGSDVVLQVEAVERRLSLVEEGSIEGVDRHATRPDLVEHPEDGRGDSGELLVRANTDAGNAQCVLVLEVRHEQERVSARPDPEADGALVS